MAHAINSSSGNSLVLIDEFGKGTNTVRNVYLHVFVHVTLLYLNNMICFIISVNITNRFHT